MPDVLPYSLLEEDELKNHFLLIKLSPSAHKRVIFYDKLFCRCNKDKESIGSLK